MSYQIIVVLVILSIAYPINGLNSRKLDESTLPGPPGSENKCGGCSQSPPPPPPSPPPPSPPPPLKKPPTSSQYCPPPPPPPPSSFIYISGPPGNLYPVDPYFSGTGRSFTLGLPLLVGCGLVALLAFW